MEGAAYQHILSGDKTADTWNYTFENLPVYRDGEEGKEILYTASVEEAVKDSIYGTYISMANGQEEEVVRYTASYMDANGNTTANLADSAKAYVKLTHSTDQGTVYLTIRIVMASGRRPFRLICTSKLTARRPLLRPTP